MYIEGKASLPCSKTDRKRGIEIDFVSTAGALDGVAHGLKFGHEKVAMVALDFDLSVLDRSAGSALLLELLSEVAEAFGMERHTGDDRHALPLPTLGFTTNANNTVALRRGLFLLLGANSSLLC